MAGDNQKKTYGKGRGYFKGGIHVLNLRGTYNEMAAQHGALLKKEIHQGPLTPLGTKNFSLIEQAPIFEKHPKLQKIMWSLVQTFIQKPMRAQIPRHYLEEARELCKAADFPYDVCEQALLQADTFTLLVRYSLGRHLLGDMTGFPGCTSVVALGPATGGKAMIHGRNMDYPFVGRWDVYPTVFFCDPEGSDRGQRYVGISSAGVHTPGVTAVNESGLGLSTHFHCSRAVSPFGTPIQFIGSEIIKRARTLGQAVDIAGDFERAASWSIVVSSAKENTAAVIEMTHGKISVREPHEGKLVHTNHFHTPELQESEILLSGSIAQDFVARCERATHLLTESHGRIDREVVARILGDHYDAETKRVRAQGNTISVITTITSMMAELGEGRFWVANRGEAPTCLGDYTGFKMDETFEGYEDREAEIFRWTPQATTTIRGTPKEESFRLFREAYIAFHMNHDLKRTLEYIEKAANADAEEANYHLAHGHFRMRMKQPERAYEAFRKAAACEQGAHMKHVTQLFEGHALDVLGRREEARVKYKAVIEHATTPQIVKEAKLCLKRPYRIDRAAKITFDMQFCDSIEFA